MNEKNIETAKLLLKTNGVISVAYLQCKLKVSYPTAVKLFKFCTKTCEHNWISTSSNGFIMDSNMKHKKYVKCSKCNEIKEKGKYE